MSDSKDFAEYIKSIDICRLCNKNWRKKDEIGCWYCVGEIERQKRLKIELEDRRRKDFTDLVRAISNAIQQNSGGMEDAYKRFNDYIQTWDKPIV